jgi:capsular polysaccharide biosynthesis protein
VGPLLRCAAVFDRLRRIGRLSNYEVSPLDRLAAKVRLPLDRLYNERIIPDVRRLTEAATANGSGPREPHVLIVTQRVWQNHALTETMIGHALRERGARVSILTCGGGLPLCTVGWARRAHPRPCDRCAHFTDAVAAASGFEHHRLADHLPWGGNGRRAPTEVRDVVDPPRMDYERAGATTAMWALQTTRPNTVPNGPEVMRDTTVTAAAVDLAFSAVLDEVRPDIVFLVNGILVEEHVMAKVARSRGIRAVTYGYGIHENTMMLASGESPALEARNDELWTEARDEALDQDEDDRLSRLLAEREQGSGTAEYFRSASNDVEQLRRDLDIPDGVRLVSLFSNVTWDSACLFKDVGFENANDWIRHVVRVAGGREDCYLVIRVHPAESELGTAEPAIAAVENEFAELPANVRVVPSEVSVHSYTLIDASDVILVYTSTTGMEAAVRGKPVVVAGDTHYRGRGFTIDAQSRDDLTRAIQEGLEPLDPERIELARRYAYAFFFRQMCPIPSVVQQTGPQFSKVVPEEISLGPGADPYLDLICDRILDGRPLSVPRDLVRFPSPFPAL